MLDDDGDHLGRRLLSPLEYGGGELDEPLAPDEIDVERRPQGVSPPARAGGLFPGLFQESVVQGRNQGSVFWYLPAKEPQQNGGYDGGVHPFPGEKPIIGGPVLELPAAGGQQSGDGPAARADQGA